MNQADIESVCLQSNNDSHEMTMHNDLKNI